MPLGQAIALAAGLTAAILAYLYLTWRARRSDRTGVTLRRWLAIATAALMFVTGTAIMAMPVSNAPLTTGVVLFIYSTALLRVRSLSLKPPTWRVVGLYGAGRVVGTALVAIGCVRQGGPIGYLGAAIALPYSMFGGVLLWSIARHHVNTPSPDGATH